MRDLIDLILTRDHHQRLRLTHSGLAWLLIFAGVVLMHYVTSLGLNDGAWVDLWTTMCLLGMGLFFALIRSGWTQRLQDPSLTMLQMFYAIACAAVAYGLAGEAQGAALVMVTVVLMFGMFGMSSRQTLATGAYALGLFAAVMVFMAQQDPSRYPVAVQQVSFIMMAIFVCASVVISAHLRAMRDRLRRQRSELADVLSRIRELATRDDLTGLINRRHMRELLETECSRTPRAPQPWSVALLDIDHFKRVNDQHGHAVGDSVLRAVAQAGLSVIRQGDVLARWGGEEFVLLLRDVEPDVATMAVERLRKALAAHAVDVDGSCVKVTVSVGIAPHIVGEPTEQTLARADAALYVAKEKGRNQTVVAA